MEGEQGCSILGVFRKHAIRYVRIRKEQFILESCERIAKTIASLSHAAVILLTAFFASLFLFITIGLGLSILLQSYAFGFLCISALYSIICLILILCKGCICRKISNSILLQLVNSNTLDLETKLQEKEAELNVENEFFKHPIANVVSEISPSLIKRFTLAMLSAVFEQLINSLKRKSQDEVKE